MRPYCDLLRLPSPGDAHAEIVAHLDAGGDPRAHRNTALRWACDNGHLDILDRLIAGSPGVSGYPGLTLADLRADFTYTLQSACSGGHLAVLERLMGLGLTAEDARAYNNVALRWACRTGKLDIVERLLSLGLTAADARRWDSEALRWACWKGRLAVLERLIALGLTADDARARDNYALREACTCGHRAVVARLLELGVEPTSYALVLCGAGQPDEDDDEWTQRLWRAVEHWEYSQVLAVAESGLTPAQLEAWETAKDRSRPSRLRYVD